MGSLDEKIKSVTASTNLLDEMKLLKELQHDQQTGLFSISLISTHFNKLLSCLFVLINISFVGVRD